MRTAANSIACPVTCEIIDRSQLKFNTGITKISVTGSIASGGNEYLYSTLPAGLHYAIAIR